MLSGRNLLGALALLAASLGGAAEAAAPPDAPPIEQGGPVPGTCFKGHATRDALGRRIVFYLSTAEAGRGRLPLAVFIQGSGCDSVFVRRGDRIAGRLQNVLLEAARGRGRVLTVEKPGVAYLDESKRPGTAERCPTAFLEEHTLPRWPEAVGAAIQAACSLPGIDPARSLVDILRAELAARAKDVTTERIDGADHGFRRTAASGPPTELRNLMARVVDWFLR